MMELIHYGSSKFDPEKFKPVMDSVLFVKPWGGLWTSPVDSEHGWREWCLSANPHMLGKESFKLSFSGNIFVIDSRTDLDKLQWETAYGCEILTFPRWEPLIEQGFDAVHLTWRGQCSTRLVFPRNLYGWDCESVLVMNPKAITLIS